MPLMEKRYGVPVRGNEKEILGGFLDHYRKTMIDVCEGLSFDELRKPRTPSGTSLLGLVKHLAWCEIGWFQECVAGHTVDFPPEFDTDPDADLRVGEDESTEEIMDLYRKACEDSRAVLDKASLDDLAWSEYRQFNYNARWVVVHMIEETARHAGHADILREMIDGRTGAGYQED